MTDLVEKTFESASASADGTRNSFTLFCEFTSQSMNYAACLWRQGVLAKPDIKTPADWAPCTQARNCNRCTALEMRSEETLQNKAIYFVDRAAKLAPVSTWGVRTKPIYSSSPAPAAPVKRTEPKRSAAPVSMIDAMGSVGDFAAAISIPETPIAAPPPRPAPIKVQAAPIMMSQSGESPLQMARRMAAERSK